MTSPEGLTNPSVEFWHTYALLKHQEIAEGSRSFNLDLHELLHWSPGILREEIVNAFNISLAQNDPDPLLALALLRGEVSANTGIEREAVNLFMFNDAGTTDPLKRSRGISDRENFGGPAFIEAINLENYKRLERQRKRETVPMFEVNEPAERLDLFGWGEKGDIVFYFDANALLLSTATLGYSENNRLTISFGSEGEAHDLVDFMKSNDSINDWRISNHRALIAPWGSTIETARFIRSEKFKQRARMQGGFPMTAAVREEKPEIEVPSDAQIAVEVINYFKSGDRMNVLTLPNKNKLQLFKAEVGLKNKANNPQLNLSFHINTLHVVGLTRLLNQRGCPLHSQIGQRDLSWAEFTIRSDSELDTIFSVLQDMLSSYNENWDSDEELNTFVSTHLSGIDVSSLPKGLSMRLYMRNITTTRREIRLEFTPSKS